MLGGSLFERLRGEFNRSIMNEDDILYQSIANNLSSILSTNTGNSETVPSYGKVDLNNMDLNPKNSQKFIENSLMKSIALYEKRLINCHVTIINDTLEVSTMNIYVDGDIFIRGESMKVTFKAKIYGDGSIKVTK